MTRRRWHYVLLAATICLAIAGTALAASSYKSGSYRGKTGQTNPKYNKKFVMRFKIAKGKISNVSTRTRDKCPDGSFLDVIQDAFKSAPLDSKGRFTLRAGTAQQPAVMKGKVTGSTASGTITDKTLDNAGSGICKASTTWTAKLVVKKK
jgi:hypothetical protein